MNLLFWFSFQIETQFFTINHGFEKQMNLKWMFSAHLKGVCAKSNTIAIKLINFLTNVTQKTFISM
jgi:hypothetical protein